MSRWEIALQILKFLSLGVSLASGSYATFQETKDKARGRLTRAGKIVFGLLIISSVIAIASQALESKNTSDKATADAKEKLRQSQLANQQAKQDAIYRDEQIKSLGTILETARTSSTNSQKAADQTVRASETLHAITVQQMETMEATWRLQRPFGSWTASAQVIGFPLDATAKQEWLDRVLDRARKSGRLSPDSDSTNPDSSHRGWMDISAKDELFKDSDLFSFPGNLLRDTHLFFEEKPFAGMMTLARVEPEAGLVLFLHPETIELSLHVDLATSKVLGGSAAITYSVFQRTASSALSNWVDLYGRQAILFFPGAWGNAESVDLNVSYIDTINPHSLSIRNVKGAPKNRFSRIAEKASVWYTGLLTEEDLGAFPNDYRQLFPLKLRGINDLNASEGLRPIEP